MPTRNTPLCTGPMWILWSDGMRRNKSLLILLTVLSALGLWGVLGMPVLGPASWGFITVFFILVGIPIVTLIWFLCSLIAFLRNRTDDNKRRRLTIHLVSSSVVLGVIVTSIASLVILFSLAIAHM